MKRHESLRPLSNEHHRALKLALTAKHAAKSQDPVRIQQIAALCDAAFRGEFEPHFQTEETEILPFLKAAGATELAARLIADHAELRSIAASLINAEASTLLCFAESMNAHVRFEERQLFPAIERLINA